MMPETKLGCVTSKIGSGATPRGGSTVYQTDGVSFIRSQNVLDNRMKVQEVARLAPEAADELRGVSVEPGDVLLNITGDSIARCCLVESAVLPARVSQHVAIIRTNARMDSRFLQRALVNAKMKASLLTMSTGGTRKALTKAMLERIMVPFPGLETQRAIAEVLAALDDKIAANAHVCSAAVALADAQFAARAGVWVSDGTTFAEVADIGGGGTPSTADATLWNGEIAWATPTDVTALRAPYLLGTSRTITAKGLASCASPLYPMGSILMTSRATIGAFAIAERPTAVNQGFIVVNARQPSSQWWFFHQMRARVSEFLSYANGATFLELSRGQFRQLPVWTAEDSVVAEFDAVADVLHRRASAAMQETAQLALLRDTLLPELMSGRLRVKDAERVVEDAV